MIISLLTGLHTGMLTGLITGLAAAQAAPDLGLTPPLSEVRHPRYEDANGVPVTWKQVKQLAKGTDALKRVRARRAGRTVLHIAFAGATVAEVYGVSRLSAEQNIWAVPLGLQAASTGVVGILLWTSTPRYVQEDRAILLRGANAMIGNRQRIIR